jgi:nucleotide-binding universal stress UspA family protein
MFGPKSSQDRPRTLRRSVRSLRLGQRRAAFGFDVANPFDGDPRRIGDRIPCCVRCMDPALGRVGMTGTETLASGKRVLRAKTTMQRVGRELLSHARSRAATAGAKRRDTKRLDARLRHGDFIETAIELQGEVDLFVLGELHHASEQARLRTERHLERETRGVSSSVLVATTEAFEVPRRVVAAFDGSPGARKALARLAQHPLTAGMPVLIAMVATDTTLARQRLKEAQATLQAAGVSAEVELTGGEPQQILPELLKRQAPALLVMGAFGHARLRQLLLGSTTTSLLRLMRAAVKPRCEAARRVRRAAAPSATAPLRPGSAC